jgi:chromosome segregation ATPase|tara:strand:- start:1534 stop:1905 length:372 start_codon:yes stop_codon:yes gene_type:complete
MKILATILLTLLFVQSYFFYDLNQKNKALDKEYQDAGLAISYHEKKNIEMIKQVQFAENKIAEMDASVTKQKIDYTELQAKNDQLKHTINQLKQKNNSQEIFVQQKDKEIIILKNELLKYLSE